MEKKPFAMQGFKMQEASEPKKEEMVEKPSDEKSEGVHVHISKNNKGYHSKIEGHDDMGPQEQDHSSLDEAKAAYAEALEKKFGEDKVEAAEEKVAPGVHQKVDSYLSQMGKKE